MKMDIVAGSQNDEFYTPEYAVKPILEFLKTSSKIWCPFDTKESNFVKLLSAAGHYVLYSHINQDVVHWDGGDFFKKEVSEADYIISNPPYSLKNEVFERLFKIGKPFAMLVGVVGLFESKKRFEMFRSNEFEIMYLSKRIAYFKDFSEPKPSLNPPFSSVYLTSKMLPQKIIFREVIK